MTTPEFCREAVSPINSIRMLWRRFANRPDAEHLQISIRLAIVSIAMLYFFSAYFENSANNPDYVLLAHWAVSIAFAVTIALLVALLINPGTSIPRRIVGMLHDITAISTAMFLGEGSAAGVAAIYLWVTLGNGFRYGTKYLYGCALLSFVGFGAVVVYSDYWHQQSMLSLNVLILLAAIPPYVGRLLTSLQNAKAELKQQARFDGLTGLINRLEIKRKIESVLRRKQGGHFLLFCDLDHFKAVNDVAGHAAGDKLLIDVGRIIAECVRSDDFTARLGGDEFCVFVQDCPEEVVRRIAENVRNSVSGYRLAWGTDYFSVGVSVGVAPSSAVSDMESLFRLADAACYAAKNAGRNQVHIVDRHTDLTDTQVVRKLFTEGKTEKRPISPTKLRTT